MKLVLFYIILLTMLCIQPTNAQTVEWSNQQKLKSKNNYSMVLGENASGYYLLRSKDNDFNRELIIEKYKSNLALANTKDIWQPPLSYVHKIFLQPSGMIAFGIVRNNATDKLDIFTWQIDDNLNTDQKLQSLFQVDYNLMKNRDAFYIKQSSDKSKFLIMYLMQSKEDNKGSSLLCLQTFTNEFVPIYKREIPLSNGVDDVYITSFECDNEGGAYVLIDFAKANITKRKTEHSRNFYLYSFNSIEPSVLTYPLNNDSTDISDLGLAINSYDKSVTVSGFYNRSKVDESVDGIFILSYDMATTTIREQKFEPFEKSFITKTTTTISNENSPGLNDLAIRKIIPRSDGGCILLAEKVYETKQTYTYYVNGFPQTSSRTIYNCDEMFVFSISPVGKIQFHQIIKKRQASINDGGYYSSFVTLNTNSSISLIYSIDATAEGDIMISSITPKGDVDTRILIKAMSYYVSLMPPESRQVSSNSTLICALKDRKFSLMKVTY